MEEFPKPKPGQCVILVVDDEPEVCKLIRTTLEFKGYYVLVAGSGHEAIQLSKQYPGRIQLLLTDIVMPGISGIELVKTISAERPGLQCLLISGFPVVGLPRGMSFLQKPFRPEDLHAKVSELLGLVRRV